MSDSVIPEPDSAVGVVNPSRHILLDKARPAIEQLDADIAKAIEARHMPGPEVRIARSDVAEMRPGTVSIMPAGLDQQLAKQELADLVAFLKATKWGPR